VIKLFIQSKRAFDSENSMVISNISYKSVKRMVLIDTKNSLSYLLFYFIKAFQYIIDY